MKHVLIPTDFTIGSLQAVHMAMVSFPEETIHITLLHLLEMPTGIGELLFGVTRREPKHLINHDFQKACEIIKNKYSSRIKKVEVSFGYGDTKRFVRNLLEGLNVDAIALDPEYELSRPHTASVPMLPLLRRSGFRIIELPPMLKAKSMEQISISSLLLKSLSESA